MKVVKQLHEIYAQIDFARREGKKVGLVPTMGALHEGHYSLIRESVAHCDCTVATIFVNPSQFDPKEDLSRYPRTLDADLSGLLKAGTDYVFVPETDAIYHEDHSTWVDPPLVATPLEGLFRPNHYRGVATVVLKLFNMIPASIAYFGLKDYQQLLVIRRMVEDFNIPIRIEACATIRDTDGLAMSSRNRYLSSDERKKAISIPKALDKAAELVSKGERNVEILEAAMQKILEEGNVSQIDYARVVDAETLGPIAEMMSPSVALIAVRVGHTRLIDNRQFD